MEGSVRAGFVAGLEGVVAAETRLSGVDGGAGELTIAGFPVEELAGRASFEETVYLLWHGALRAHQPRPPGQQRGRLLGSAPQGQLHLP